MPSEYFNLDLNEYWGKGSAKAYKEDKTIKPFKISYSPEVSLAGADINEYLLKYFCFLFQPER